VHAIAFESNITVQFRPKCYFCNRYSCRMKKILVIHYSQSGQLTRILESLVSEMNNSCEIEFAAIEPETPYPFPWDKAAFFDAMPDTVKGKTKPNKPLRTKHDKYDLIILGYQVWFLNPSIPFHSFLCSDEAPVLLKDTPVVTVLGVRNMWVMAQEKVKLKLAELGSNLVGNIAFIDRAPNMISVITIQEWLFTGRKSKKWGFLPWPGVAEKEIEQAGKFGKVIAAHLVVDSCNKLQDELVKQNAVALVDTLVFIEKRGSVMFRLWASLIDRKSTTPERRKFWLKVYHVYLLFAIFIIAPIVLLIYTVSKLVLFKRVKKDMIYYQGVKLRE